METVTIQCGGCQQVIAVSKEHLGQQVQCPLCGAVIEAPAPPDAADNDVPIPYLPVANEEDSIFAPPEAEEDIFGRRDERPLVEMPSDAALDRKPEDGPPRQRERAERVPSRAGAALHDHPPEKDGGSSVQSELASFKPRRYDRGSFGAIVLIFLVPYSIVITLALVYLLVQRMQFDRFEMLPDPNGNDGRPRYVERVKHDAELSAKLRRGLQQPIRIGDIEVTALKVEQTSFDQLVLHLKMKNVSRNVAFNPFPDSFHMFTAKKAPYTFLDSQPRLYGGYTARYRQPPDQRRGGTGMFSGVIGPGETLYAELTTYEKDDYRNVLPKILATHDDLLWRIHVRRGLVKVRGQPVSATAVIGFQFSPNQVDRVKG